MTPSGIEPTMALKTAKYLNVTLYLIVFEHDTSLVKNYRTIAVAFIFQVS
jgi:hypothetical protein